jgi:hypothetical protein
MAKPKSTAEPSILSRVRLRPLLPEEPPRFDQLLQEPHYLTGGRLHLRPQGQSKRDTGAGSSPAAGDFFCAQYDSGWSKENGRLQRWQAQRVGLSPEEAGLCGCWQMVAVKRERQTLRRGQVVEEQSQLSYYVSSLSVEQRTAAEMAGHIREHWAACESASHYRHSQACAPSCGAERLGSRRRQPRSFMAYLRSWPVTSQNSSISIVLPRFPVRWA